MKRTAGFVWIGVFLLSALSSGTQTLPEEPDGLCAMLGSRIRWSGYVKYLQSSFLVSDGFGGAPAGLIDQLYGGVLHDHLIHHRLNMQADLGHGIHVHAGLRNRLFYGDQVRLIGLAGDSYARQADAGSNDYLDLSFTPLDKKSWAMHAVLDRLFLEWKGDRDEIRIGRQRVNWGVGTLWNPNDLFNAYSFIDFDYEERPGSDAVRWTHYRSGGDRWEVAARPSDTISGVTIAGLYRGHVRGVDFQVLAAWHQGDLALGGGWEADLGKWAWKGEATVFVPAGVENRNTVVAVSTDWMRTWGSGALLGGGYFLNTGAGSSTGLLTDFSTRLSARHLYPFRHNLFVQAGYPVTPLFQVALAAVYSPDKTHTAFVSPVLTYNLATDWDIDLTGQVLVQDDGQSWNSPVQAFFLRLRWSY